MPLLLGLSWKAGHGIELQVELTSHLQVFGTSSSSGPQLLCGLWQASLPGSQALFFSVWNNGPLPGPHIRLLGASHLLCGTVPGTSRFNSLTVSQEVLSGAPLHLWVLQLADQEHMIAGLTTPLSGTHRSAASISHGQNPQDEDKTPVVFDQSAGINCLRFLRSHLEVSGT